MGDTIRELSLNLFDKFSTLAKNEKNGDLKETYEFLAAYWTVPAILTPDTENLKKFVEY